jgi:hypothetical protein
VAVLPNADVLVDAVAPAAVSRRPSPLFSLELMICIFAHSSPPWRINTNFKRNTLYFNFKSMRNLE